MLMPLPVKLIDSEIDVPHGMITQVANCFDYFWLILEDIGARCLAVDLDAPFSNLNVYPIDGDV